MQGFHFHIEEPGTYTAVLTLDPKAQEKVELVGAELFDHLEGLPDVAIKTSQNIETGAAVQLTQLTSERKERDDKIWKALPPLNIHWQIHEQVNQFNQPPAGAKVGKWTKVIRIDTMRWTSRG